MPISTATGSITAVPACAVITNISDKPTRAATTEVSDCLANPIPSEILYNPAGVASGGITDKPSGDNAAKVSDRLAGSATTIETIRDRSAIVDGEITEGGDTTTAVRTVANREAPDKRTRAYTGGADRPQEALQIRQPEETPSRHS